MFDEGRAVILPPAEAGDKTAEVRRDRGFIVLQPGGADEDAEALYQRLKKDGVFVGSGS